MPWEQRFFKGDEVFVEVDEDGEPILEDGRVPMKYEDRHDVKIYHAHPANIAGDLDESKEAWRREIEEREAELDEREAELDTRKKKLDEREEALDAWERELKAHGLEGEPIDGAPESTSDSGEDDGADEPPREIAELDPPEDDVVEIHTDGACSGNPGPCGFGAVVRTADDYRELYEFLGEGTNNVAELEGIRAALESVDDRSRPVRLYTDSRYAIGVLTQGWNAKANRELIEETRDLLATFDDVELRKVEGHAGHEVNEHADDLARRAVPDLD